MALALCVDSWVVSTAETMHARLRWKNGLAMAAVFAMCQALFPLLGAGVGEVAGHLVQKVDHWVAFILLAWVGGKMIIDGLKSGTGPDLRRERGHRQLTVFVLLGMATSIDAFAVGIGLRLEYPMTVVVSEVAMIGLFTFMAALLGVYLGRRKLPVPEKIASVMAGVVLIGLGVKILLENYCG